MALRKIKENQKNLFGDVLNEMRYYEQINNAEGVSSCEENLMRLGKEMEILAEIETKKEGNLIRFNDDKSFRLTTVRITENGVIVEEYQDNFTKETYYDVLEESKCCDISEDFDFDNLSDVVCARELKEDTDMYFFVTNDTLEEYVSETQI